MFFGNGAHASKFLVQNFWERSKTIFGSVNRKIYYLFLYKYTKCVRVVYASKRLSECVCVCVCPHLLYFYRYIVGQCQNVSPAPQKSLDSTSSYLWKWLCVHILIMFCENVHFVSQTQNAPRLTLIYRHTRTQATHKKQTGWSKNDRKPGGYHWLHLGWPLGTHTFMF